MPITPDIRRQFGALLNAHDEAFRALRAANTAMAAANEGMGNASDAMGTAIQAHDHAIQAALTANCATIDLLERLAGDGTP